MKNKIIDSIGKIDDDMIESVDALRQSKKKHSNKKNTWVKLGAMAACLCLVIVGAVTTFPKHYDTMAGDPIKSENTDLAENNSIPGAAHTENAVTSNDAGVGSYATADHMIEILVKVDIINSWGFIGTIETGAVADACTFGEGEQLSVVCEENVTIVQKDGSIFDFDETEPNVDESDLEVGDSVWIGFQTYDYAEGNGRYNQVLAYHVNRTLTDAPVDESSESFMHAAEYPNEILEMQQAVSDAMARGDLPYVVGSSILEDPLRLEIVVTTTDENKIQELKSEFDPDGCYIVIVQSSGAIIE